MYNRCDNENEIYISLSQSKCEKKIQILNRISNKSKISTFRRFEDRCDTAIILTIKFKYRYRYIN